MYLGKHAQQISDNHQLTLPSAFRKEMSGPVYLAQGFDRNLLLLSQEAFSAIYVHVKATSISDPLARLMNRLFLGSAVEISIDSSGQIELPLSLCEYAGLGREVILVGQGDYAEIWAGDLWQKQLESLNDHEANAHRFEKFHVSLT
jgi:MraZ protein